MIQKDPRGVFESLFLQTLPSEIANSLVEKLAAIKHFPEKFEQEYAKIEPDLRPPDWFVDFRSVVQEYYQEHVRDAVRKPVVVLYDDVKYLSEPMERFIEGWIIKPLVTGGERNVVLKVQQKARDWQTTSLMPHVRANRGDIYLSSFEIDGTELQAEKMLQFLPREERNMIAHEVHALTYGHPEYNALLLREIERRHVSLQEIQHSPNLLRWRFQDVVRSTLISRYGGQVFEDLETMACLGPCDRIMLHTMLDDIGRMESVVYREPTSALVRSGLLAYNHGYRVNEGTRRILQDFVQLFQPDRYASLQMRAFRYLENVLSQPIDARPQYILQTLFYVVSLASMGVGIDPEEKLTEYLARFETYPDQQTRREELTKVRNGIETEADLQHVLGSDTRVKLVKVVDQFIARASASVVS